MWLVPYLLVLSSVLSIPLKPADTDNAGKEAAVAVDGVYLPTIAVSIVGIAESFNAWMIGLNSEKLQSLCAFKPDDPPFDNAIDSLLSSAVTATAPAAGVKTGGTPDGKSSLADSVNVHAPNDNMAAPDPNVTAMKKMLVGEGELPMQGSTPSKKKCKEANVAGQVLIRKPTRTNSMLDVGSDQVALAVDPEDPGDIGEDDSFRHGMHYATAHHALRRISRERSNQHRKAVGSGDVLYEGYEHESTRQPDDVALPELDSDLLTLGNGVTIKYSQIIGLAGDFYGMPDCPISYGPVNPSKGGDSSDENAVNSFKPGDAREALIKKAYEHCGWDYKAHVRKLLDRCPTRGRGRKTDTELRFLSAFNTLDQGDATELREINKVFKEEHQRIRNMASAVIDYLDVGNDLNFQYAKVTGAKLREFPRPIGTVPDGGRFMNLATFNVDHFGDWGENPPARWNQVAYMSGHRAAMEMAKQARWTNDITLLRKAYAMNAFADHFLTDMFSSGHTRPMRKQLHDCCSISSLGGELPWGDLFAKFDHDEGNFHGLWMTSEKGGVWRAYGDKFWFSAENSDNRARAIAAVQASINEIALAYNQAANGNIPAPSNMRQYYPVETRSKENFKPLFILDNGTLKIREPMDDPWNSNPTYTSKFVGASSSMKLRYIAWEREYWYKAAHPVPAVADIDATRYFGARDGLGTDEHVMLELLALRTNDEVKAMKAAYLKLYPERDIVADTKKDTSGHFQKLLLVMLLANKRPGPISLTDAVSFARQLKAGGEDKIGTDDDLFIDILARNDMQSNGLVMDEYRKISQMTLPEAIKSEMSGVLRDSLILLIPRPETRIAASASNAIKPPAYTWDATAANQLYNAMTRLGTDERAVARVLRPFDNVQMQQVINTFEGKYGRALRKNIESETSGWTRKALLHLLATNKRETAMDFSLAKAMASALFAAGEDRWGTDEQVFINNLCGQPLDNVMKISAAYARLFGHSIGKAIDHEFSGTIRVVMHECANNQ